MKTGESGNSAGCLRAGDTVVTDRRWAADVRAAVFCAAALLVLLHLVDLAAGTLDVLRSGLWTALAAVLFSVLFPSRVTAGRHWIAVRGLLGERRVSTDLLTRVGHRDGLSPRIVLRDVWGARVEVEVETLAANPLLWHELDTGARRAREDGLLSSGSAVLQSLAQRIESDTAREVFEASGLR